MDEWTAVVDELKEENNLLKEKLEAHCKHFDEVRSDRDRLEEMWLNEKKLREKMESELQIAQSQLRVVNLIFGGKNDPCI